VPSSSHSQQLRTKLRLAEPCLLQVSDRFWTHPRLPQIFPEFLFMMHSIIRSSVALIGAAAESAERRAASEPACRALASYYKTHAVEETHHDDWLLDDMIAIGMDRAEVLSRLPSPAVAELVGAQYYWAMHAHPISLLGYLAVFEGNPSSLKELDAIRKKHGLPAAGLRTMIKHARLDPHHRDEIYAVLDEFPLTEKHSELVALSAFHTLDHLAQAIQEILDSHRVRPGVNARVARAV
jgi:Iron-containing redox enzyme